MINLEVISSLPELSSYTHDEITEFKEYSSASKIYFELIKNPEIDPIFKFRHEAWLRTSLANFHSKSNQEQRSLFWSNSMDQIVNAVFNKFFSPEDSLLVLALGKYGSKVLNLSSDIDIILVSDHITPDLIKKARLFTQYLNAKTPDGFITRVDLNLKPSDQPGMIVTARHLSNYLWNSQELWERLAYTRSRKICGRLEDETSLFNEIEKFCFRKYIRLDLIFGLSELIQKILDNNQDDHNIKLCSGGIRSIELLLSALQLLYAGRVNEFKRPETYFILESLEKISVFSEKQIQTIKENYDILRSLEDKIQSALDEQTHHIDNVEKIKQVLEQNQKNLKIFLSTLERNRNIKDSTLIDKLSTLSKTHTHLNDFVLFLQKHTSYISLFETHPKSFQNLLKSLIYSPQVTKLILLRPDLMDLFLIKKTHFDSKDSQEEFLIKLSDFKAISQITAIGEFLTEFDLEKFLLKNSKTADLCVLQILSNVFAEEPVDILKLGKWSADELGVFSDLDFIFIYNENNDLSRQARKFISYLTHSTFHGAFYSIDLRLRPSGNAGPILTSTNKLETYIESSAPVWLRQAYLRNSLLKQNSKLKFNLPTLTENDKNEILEIRSKRFTLAKQTALSLKDNFGGIVDLEFYVQCLFLKANLFPESDTFKNQVNELSAKKLITKDHALFINEAYSSFRFFEQLTEVLFKTSQLNPTQFEHLLTVENIHDHLKGISTFNSLFELIRASQLFIEENHPFL